MIVTFNSQGKRFQPTHIIGLKYGSEIFILFLGQYLKFLSQLSKVLGEIHIFNRIL